MKIIPIFNKIINTFNEKISTNLNPLTLEGKIRAIGDKFTLYLYESFINYFDEQFKNSKERKAEYRIKQTRNKTLITSVGEITVNFTSYIDKKTGQYFVPLREILDLKPYQRLTNEAEYQLIKYAMTENMSQAAKHALRNTQVSRSTVSKKIKILNGSIVENITKLQVQPDILYIEMDEIHANLQHGGNRICPCAIVHEGYEESFAKRKKLKNTRYFASAVLNYEELWDVIYDYVDKRYCIDKFKKIFISGDGAKGIKNYLNAFPNGIFVLDGFHYKNKHLKPLFKGDKTLMNIADIYLKNEKIEDFFKLVDLQHKLRPDDKDSINKHCQFLLNNLDGIKNQMDPDYKVHCSMEGHVNQAFARYITSSPYGFSLEGLENKLNLLVCSANKHELTIQDYYNLKYGTNSYKVTTLNIRKLQNIKYDSKLTKNHTSQYNISTTLPVFDSPADNNRFKELTSIRREIYVI